MDLAGEFHPYLFPWGISRMAPENWNGRGRASQNISAPKILKISFIVPWEEAGEGFAPGILSSSRSFPIQKRSLGKSWYSHNSNSNLGIKPQIFLCIYFFNFHKWELIRAGCHYLPKEHLPQIPSTTWKYSHKPALAIPEEKSRNPLLQGILAAPFPSKPFPSFDSESGRVENAFQEFQHILEVLERRNCRNNWIFHKFQFGFVWEDNPRILDIWMDLFKPRVKNHFSAGAWHLSHNPRFLGNNPTREWLTASNYKFWTCLEVEKFDGNSSCFCGNGAGTKHCCAPGSAFPAKFWGLENKEFRPGINSCWEWELGGKMRPKNGIWVRSERLQHHGERQNRNRPLPGGNLNRK